MTGLPPAVRTSGDYRGQRLRRLKNSVLQLRFLWPLVVTDETIDAILAGCSPRRGSLRYYLRRALERTLWFYPNLQDAHTWIVSEVNGARDPVLFRELNWDARYLLDHVERHTPGFASPILDLGCNCGRHLAELHRRGFTDLTGIDVSAPALAKMSQWFPDAAAVSKLHHDFIERFLARAADRKFATVYTHGATIELLHPSFDVCGQICRVAGHAIVLLINENAHTYPRFWAWEFERHGFNLLRVVRPVGQDLPHQPGCQLTLFVFQRSGAMGGDLAGQAPTQI